MKREDSRDRRESGTPSDQSAIPNPGRGVSAGTARQPLWRIAIMASGAVGGLALGLLLVGFLEYRESGFRGEEDVLRVLTLPVLALVPLMISDSDRQAARRRGRLVDIAGTVLLLGSVAVLVVWRLRS